MTSDAKASSYFRISRVTIQCPIQSAIPTNQRTDNPITNRRLGKIFEKASNFDATRAQLDHQKRVLIMYLTTLQKRRRLTSMMRSSADHIALHIIAQVVFAIHCLLPSLSNKAFSVVVKTRRDLPGDSGVLVKAGSTNSTICSKLSRPNGVYRRM